MARGMFAGAKRYEPVGIIVCSSEYVALAQRNKKPKSGIADDSILVWPQPVMRREGAALPGVQGRRGCSSRPPL